MERNLGELLNVYRVCRFKVLDWVQWVPFTESSFGLNYSLLAVLDHFLDSQSQTEVLGLFVECLVICNLLEFFFCFGDRDRLVNDVLLLLPRAHESLAARAALLCERGA